jgi:hypothetical protein
LHLHLRKKLVEWQLLSSALYGAENGHFGKYIKNTNVVLGNDGHQLD